MSKFISIGHYVPENIMTNSDFEKILDTNDEWIQTRTGIKQRHITINQNTSDLATLAAQDAINKAKIDPLTIDLIIVATFTPDSLTPSTASLVQAKLGLNHAKCMAFDVNAACSGFVYAITIADAMIKSGLYKRALVIGAEVISKILDFSDRSTCILFGDGAGATIIDYDERNNIIDSINYSQGDENELLYVPSLTLDRSSVEQVLKMNGQEVFKFACRVVKESVQFILDKNQLTIDDIDLIVPHQANYRIIKKVAKDLKYDMDRFFLNMDRYGNTSSASIPLALSQMEQEGKLKKGNKYILVGFGSGLTWGATLIEW